MIITLSLLSRITSNSNSFQPSNDSSIRTSVIGLDSKPFCASSKNSSVLYAIAPPVPPKVKDGRIIIGNSIFSNICLASFMERANPP